MPVYNAAEWIGDALQSILQQTFTGNMELSIYNDASQDESMKIVDEFRIPLETRNISIVISGHDGVPRGVGFAKNSAIQASQGEYLCFLDADDIMDPNRIVSQYEYCSALSDEVLVGCQFQRIPMDSTHRYTKWANSINHHQLNTQIYTSNGPTIIMPTWFCRRACFHRIPGGFSQSGKGTPEDLLFFHEHMKRGGRVDRVDESLLTYRYHRQNVSLSVLDSTIWNIQLAFLEENKISKWNYFSIWNAGKQGRRFYRSLSNQSRSKVTCFGDVDEKKLKLAFYTYEDSPLRPKPRIPIRHFSDLTPPIVICMKQDLTSGDFERNLSSLQLSEDIDYVLFG